MASKWIAILTRMLLTVLKMLPGRCVCTHQGCCDSNHFYFHCLRAHHHKVSVYHTICRKRASMNCSLSWGSLLALAYNLPPAKPEVLLLVLFASVSSLASSRGCDYIGSQLSYWAWIYVTSQFIPNDEDTWKAFLRPISDETCSTWQCQSSCYMSACDRYKALGYGIATREVLVLAGTSFPTKTRLSLSSDI